MCVHAVAMASGYPIVPAAIPKSRCRCVQSKKVRSNDMKVVSMIKKGVLEFRILRTQHEEHPSISKVCDYQTRVFS